MGHTGSFAAGFFMTVASPRGRRIAASKDKYVRLNIPAGLRARPLGEIDVR